MVDSNKRNVIVIFTIAVFVLACLQTVASNEDVINHTIDTNETTNLSKDTGQISIKLSSIVQLLKNLWSNSNKVFGESADNIEESRTFGMRRRMIMNTLVPFAFFMGKMTIIIFAIKLIGLMNLKVGVLLLIVNIGVLLAKLLALKKGYGHHHHPDPSNSHYYFNFPSGGASAWHYPKYTIKHHSSYPKSDIYNKYWEDIHRNDQADNTVDPTYGPQIPNPYYASQLEQLKLDQLKYAQQIPPYPQYQHSYHKRQLLSVDDQSLNEQDNLKQEVEQEAIPTTTTAQQLSTILDTAMLKLSN